MAKTKLRTSSPQTQKTLSAPPSKPAPSPSEAASSSSASNSDSGSSNSDSDDTSGSDSDSDSDASVTSDYMASLLVAAKKNLSEKAKGKQKATEDLSSAEIMLLNEGVEDQKPLPALDPGSSLPKAYLKLSSKRADKSTLEHDPDVERVEKVASTTLIAATLPPAPELNPKTGKPLTKAEKKAVRDECLFSSLPPADPVSRPTSPRPVQLKDQTAGAGWFDLPAPPASELPRLAREVEAMRLANALDPKRFYRKEDTKAGPLPKHFVLGHIVSTPNPFGAKSRDDLPGAKRKRTFVDELMDDDEARTYAKKKFMDLQGVNASKGRGTYRKKFAKRQKKF